MESNRILNANLNTVRKDSFLAIERLRSEVAEEIKFGLAEIKDLINKSFRQFLLSQEQEKMPFLQRVVTAHLENMESERGFPPRHPIHWVKSKLEFSSSGVLEFDTERDTEKFIQSALKHIEADVKEQLQLKQQAILQLVNQRILELQGEIGRGIQAIAQEKKIIASEYVNGFIRTNQLTLKALDRFYFVSDGQRFDPHQEASYNQVCVRPGSRLGWGKQSPLKFAVSCDRLLDIVNQSLQRSIDQLQQQSQAYLTGELPDRVAELFTNLQAEETTN
jgi:hypothetical protein